MRKVKITAIRKTVYDDLIKEYENPIEHTCDIKVNDVFFSKDCTKPDGFCESAWETILPFVKELSKGPTDFYDGWMKDKNTAMISCNDGFRPVSFLLQGIDE